MSVEIVSVVHEGLGHSAHLVAIDGEALVVDPARTVDDYLRVVAGRGWTLRWSADTHLHADYVSGGPELAARGAAFLAPRAARLLMNHDGLDGGDEVDVAGLTLRALPTPGHTPDHLAYVLLDGSEPLALFSGGSLMVGTVGRPDLLGPAHTDELARQMYRSLRDHILVLPDELSVYPTHGAGSFCSAPGASARVTTIGRERASNPLLRARDEDEFVRLLVGGLGTFPSYYAHLPELNRRGLGKPPSSPLRPLRVGELAALLGKGASVVDVRSPHAYAAGHVPGSLSNALRPVFASWLGWLVPPKHLLAFVTDDSTDRDELARQCALIGYDAIAGELAGGIDAWRREGRPVATTSIHASTSLHSGDIVIDVRQAHEYRAGHIPGARNIELGNIPTASLPAGPVTVMCGHGERAATAASVFEARGVAVTIATGGPDDWAGATGHPLEVGA